MLPLRIVEHLDVIEHILSCVFACPVGPAPDPFAFEQIEEALGDCVVMTVAAAAHGMLKIVSTQECGQFHAGELTALIRMDQHLVLRLSSPDGHHQGLQNDICRLTALHGPADHAPEVKIDNHREVDEPYLRPDIGNIGHPDLVRCLDVELPVESIIDHDRWLATITAGAAPVADLRLDTCKLSQSGYPVRTDALALFNQIVMQLAIAIDLAALRPSLLQQLGLAPVFLRPCAQRFLQPCIEPALPPENWTV